MDSSSLSFQETKTEAETDIMKKTEKEIATEEDTVEIGTSEIEIFVTETSGIVTEISVIEVTDQEVLMILATEDSIENKVFYITFTSNFYSFF